MPASIPARYMFLSLFLFASSLDSSVSKGSPAPRMVDDTGPFMCSWGSVVCKVSGSGFEELFSFLPVASFLFRSLFMMIVFSSPANCRPRPV